MQTGIVLQRTGSGALVSPELSADGRPVAAPRVASRVALTARASGWRAGGGELAPLADVAAPSLAAGLVGRGSSAASRAAIIAARFSFRFLFAVIVAAVDAPMADWGPVAGFLLSAEGW